MANDVINTEYTVGGRASNYQDRVFDATALPNATTLESSVFRFAKTQARTELVITANTAITIADGQSIIIDLHWDDDKGGSFTESRTVASYSPSGETKEFAIGDTVGIITPESDIEHYCKVIITATANQSAGKVDGKIYRNA